MPIYYAIKTFLHYRVTNLLFIFSTVSLSLLTLLFCFYFLSVLFRFLGRTSFRDLVNKKGSMEDTAPEDEPPKDPRMNQHHSSTVDEVEGHRHQNVYLGLQIPTHRHRSRHHRHRHHRHHSNKDSGEPNRPGQ